MIRTLRLAIFIATLFAYTGSAFAQSYPTRPITLIVPYVAGGGVDVAARKFAAELSKVLGGNIVIENKAGASTGLAAEYVARAPKDGYTLLFGTTTTFAVNPHIQNDIHYKVDDFEPISDVFALPFIFVVSNKLPVSNIKEFIEYARQNPGKINYGTPGVGNAGHALGEMLKEAAGLSMTAVPYRGGTPAATDVIAGNLDAQIDGITTVIARHNAGSYKAIGSFGSARSKALPNVATFVEAGYPSVHGLTFLSVYAPQGTPQFIVNKLHQAITSVAENPGFRTEFEALGNELRPSSSPAAMKDRLKKEFEHWGQILRKAEPSKSKN